MATNCGNMAELKERARAAATWRGHDLGEFKAAAHGRTAIATCNTCGAFAQVNIKPAPNEIDCGGSAVAINCGDK